MDKIKIFVIAEDFVGEANGVTTAILELISSLKADPFYELVDHIDDADLIHAHTIGLDYIKQSFKYKDKMIVSAHVIPDSFIGSLIFSRLWRPLAKRYLKYVYNRSKEVIAVSPFVKLELEKINVKSKIHVLCNSVNRQKFNENDQLRLEYRKKYNLTDEFVVTCVGQIQPRKGIYDFIESAKQCPDITFMWVGGTPFKALTAEYKTLQEVVKNAPKNIIFAGIVDFEEMPAYYAMSDVYFMPSYQENFAFATIEASSVKLPLLLRDNVEYPSSLFTHYLKGNTADDFSKILNQLKADADYFNHWRNESELLASKYSLKSYMKQLKDIYLGLLGNKDS